MKVPMWSLLLPVIAGFSTVFQSVLNREVSRSWGLSQALLVNSLVFLVVSLGLLFVTKKFPELLPDFFLPKGGEWHLWYVVPGLLGFTLVMCLPIAVSAAGTARVFIAMVGAQIVISLLWDAFAMGLPVKPLRLAGAALAFVGALLVTLSQD